MLHWGFSLEEEQLPQKRSVLGYFVHGLLFSVLSLILGFGSIFFLAVLVLTGFIIGLILGLIVLIVIVGWINAVLTSWLWKINIKTGLLSLFGQGLTLMILLFIVAIPNLVMAFLTLNSAFYVLVVIVSFSIYPFIDGYIAKTVAAWWEREPDEEYDDDISPPSITLPP
jgi:hypothetical protein